MEYSIMRVDMRIRHIKTGLKATIAQVQNGRFKYVDEYGSVVELDRYNAIDWEEIK
jgi:hypothetical protein